jgi:hypothetical protein
MGALVQTLPHHHRLRPAKEGSAPSSPCPWLPDRPAFRRILSLRFRSGPQSCSPLDQAHPLRGGRDFYTRACPTAGHPTAKSGITTQLSGPVLRRNLHPLGECCYGLQLLLRGLSLFPVFLPVLLLWIRLQVGYDARAFVAQTVSGRFCSSSPMRSRIRREISTGYSVPARSHSVEFRPRSTWRP